MTTRFNRVMIGLISGLSWPSSRCSRPSLPHLRRVARLVVIVSALLFAAEAVRVLAWTNHHIVLEGLVYRSAQPSAAAIKQMVAAYGIRTVVNLRGHCPGPEAAWYAEEVNATHAAGINQEDITLSANRLPPPTELRRLIEILDQTTYPILIHCKRGADRTGLTATIVMLLYTDATLDRARRQLLPRYGHFRFGRTAAMDEFFDRYEAWLAGRRHTPSLFREWATQHYKAGPHQAQLVRQDGQSEMQPIEALANRWITIPLLATNTSEEAWEFKPGPYTGVMLEFSLQNGSGQKLHIGQAGLVQRIVQPGESIELPVVIPPIATPGRYIVRCDLMNATGAGVPIRQMGFYQFAADPLILTVIVK